MRMFVNRVTVFLPFILVDNDIIIVIIMKLYSVLAARNLLNFTFLHVYIYGINFVL